MKKLLAIVQIMLSISALSEHWPTGYYSTVDNPTDAFYYDDENRWFCHVQNDTQSTLYNVPEQVRVIGDISGILNQAVSLDECRWPNGFYRISDTDGPVFRLYPGNICMITSAAMLAAYGGTDYVIDAEEGSNFGAHRTDIGQCFWPSYDLANTNQF